MATQALLVALVMYLAKFLDWGILNIQCRPIWICPLVGLVLGDLTQGIILGAAIEAVFMGTFSVGGSVPSDIQSGAIFGAAFGILTAQGASVDQAVTTGVAMAVPAGLLATLLFNLVVFFFNFVHDYMDRAVAAHNDKKFNAAHIFTMFFYPIPFAVMTFFGIYVGVDPISNLMANMPAQVNQALTVMSQVLPALGMAILVKSMWDVETLPFFFVGFALAAYLGLNTMAIAIIGAAFAVFYIYKDYTHRQELESLKKRSEVAPAVASANALDDEMEDFLS